ncbi:MAG: transcriptional regulator, GntR family [Herbinix sp.]|jgi:DNA-binding transcriptional regulator YhcF (GntR family)|nr:transcriptional regulator, GntR family [Herbinix sp.]
MKFQDNIPIYIQIANDIKDKIISGEYREDEKLPSIREYCAIYEVTSLTMQRAFQQLEGNEVIWTKKGIGSFVSKNSKNKLQEDMMQSQVTEFVKRMKNMGLTEEGILALIKEAFNHE